MSNRQDSHPLTNLTHLDGRNAAKLFSLRPYFSELAWMKERVYVILTHFIAIVPVVAKPISPGDIRILTGIAENFSLTDGERVVRIEKTVNHDLKSLAMFVEHAIPKHLLPLKGFVLFGLGSEDINAAALGRLVQRSRDAVIIPELKNLLKRIAELARNTRKINMIARTHGLPAGVTTFGKELANPLFRLCDGIQDLRSLTFRAKMSGEVGSFHAVSRTDVHVDWLSFGDRLIRSLDLEPYHGSTQIVPYDSLIRYLHTLSRINTILIDLSKNMWLYVLLGYVRVVKKRNEVGSSGMPHKVNPMYFEGAEGGLEMANGIIETLARTLMINRLQRDFSDSTIRRNLSLVFAYSLLSYQSLSEALDRLDIDTDVIRNDLTQHAEVWIEPMKLLMLLDGQAEAFELLKQKTRGHVFTNGEFLELVRRLSLHDTLTLAIQHMVEGKKPNPYPVRIVDEALARERKIQHL